jgi:hypothetical protein
METMRSWPDPPRVPEHVMRHTAKVLFVVVALVNLLPIAGVVGAERLAALYGMSFQGTDLLLLMRHRAILLGLVGGLLMAAAFVPTLRRIAATIGLGSMLSFVALALPLEEHGAALQRVVWVDIGASLLLGVAIWLDRRSVLSPPPRST